MIALTESIVETRALSRRYGTVTTVDGLNLRVPRGSIFGFLGPNGAGKTTTVRMLLGLVRPTAGTARLFGLDVRTHRRAVLRRLGALVESPSYYPHLTGHENLGILATLLGLPRRRVDDALDGVRLGAVAHRRVGAYSLGMKQRLGIAAAMLHEPELLILDEPTNGLDPAGIHEIRALLRSLPAERGVTVLVSSHLLREVEQIATHVGIIHHGVLMFQGDIDALRAQARARTVVAVDDAVAAQAALSRAGIAAALAGDDLVLPTADREAAAAANRALVLAGRSVFGLATERPTLEDLFLDLVGTGASL